MLLQGGGTPALVVIAASAFAAEALAKSSSGGYSRPSTSSSRSSWTSSRTPSTSGGYARPSQSGSSRPSTAYAPPRSAGDAGISRQRSADALGAYRTNQAPTPSTPASGVGGGSASPWGSLWGKTTSRPVRPSERADWYSRGGWTNPGPVMGAPRNFGIWDGVFLWALLSNLNRSGAADFFHNHQSDPGYRQWRSEADRLAADNATLRRRLEDLDRQLNERRGQRTDANYLPPGVPAGVAYATQTSDRTPSVADGDDGSGMTVWVIVALVAGGAIVGWLLWQRLSRRDGGGSMRNLGTAGAMLRQKLSNDPYRPDHFRVGMTFAFDPTPFVLLAGMTKVASPATDTGSQRLTATAIGTVTGGGVQLLRLYLPDERSVFQLHLDPTGSPDECRFFSTIDIVTPADQSEWGVWLDAREGMIGWPQFQTKDGKLYNRVWTPGSERVPPMEMTEAIESAGLPPRQIRRQSMLYATASGATAPAPDTEYILVSAVEDGRGAWVEIAAGIDVNPSMLELS